MADEMGNRSKISIWWDIENCHVPKNVDPHYIAQNITAALQHANLTGPIEIQVFGDTTILHHSTQKALSDTGITLNHVPRGNKDAADKAILVGMLLWALDNPAPANILLISGDGDFANALHRLRLKTYSILLAVPAQFVKPALTGAAKKLWFWKDMAMGQLAEPKLSQANGGDSSSQGAAGVSCAMDVFQQRHGPSGTIGSGTRCQSVPNGYSSPQKGVTQSGMGGISEKFRSLSLESNPSSLSSPGMSNDGRNSSRVMENAHHLTPSDRKMSPGGASNNSNISVSKRVNASVSQTGPPVSSPTVRSMDFGNYPYFLPRPGGAGASLPSCSPCNPAVESKPPQFSSMPSGLPRGPLKHIIPKNNRGVTHEVSVNNIVPDDKLDQGDKSNASKYRNGSNVVPSSSQLTTSIRPSNPIVNNSEMVSHDTFLDKIYSAMKTLEREMLAPTEANLSECIQYWNPQHESVDLKQALNKAAELQQITRTQLRGGLVMFFPPNHRQKWNCVDPGNMQLNHSGDVWLELQQFLLYGGEKKEAFCSSVSRYDAALRLKSSCGMHIQSMVVGKVLNLLQQAMQERKWLRKSMPGWAPLVINQLVLQEWSRIQEQKGTSRPPSTNYANPSRTRKLVSQSNTERVPDKDITLSKVRDLLRQILRDGNRYDLAWLPNDFQNATGFPLNHQKLGYANLQDLIKEFTDVASVEATSSGLLFLHPVKLNENTVGVIQNSMADKENDEMALRQIKVISELKHWLRDLMNSTKDGYDIFKIQADFLQASGKDLNREGLDIDKLQFLLRQFSDVIQIGRSSTGVWLAYPAGPSKPLA